MRRRAPEPTAPRDDATPAEAREKTTDQDPPLRPVITDWASL